MNTWECRRRSPLPGFGVSPTSFESAEGRSPLPGCGVSPQNSSFSLQPQAASQPRIALYWHNGRSLGHTVRCATLGQSLLNQMPNSIVVGITGASKGFDLLPPEMDRHRSHEPPKPRTIFGKISLAFENGFSRFREGYRDLLSICLRHPKVTMLSVLGFAAVSMLLFPFLGQDFFPQVDAGLLRSLGASRQLRVLACDVAGIILQVFALHLGTLAFVQPLLVSGLLFALLLRPLFQDQQFTGHELAWAVVLTATLSGFLVLATTGGATTTTAAGADRAPAIAAGIVGALLANACVGLGRRLRQSGRRAALLGVAVGVICATAAALPRALTDIATRHPVTY